VHVVSACAIGAVTAGLLATARAEPDEPGEIVDDLFDDLLMRRVAREDSGVGRA